MALSAFDDKTRTPRDDELAATLGDAFEAWTGLKDEISTRYAPLDVEWGFASKSTGWGLRLKQGKRAVLYMTPCRGCFLASFALGEKAVQAARASDLPVAVLAVIEAAPKYAEGRGVRLEVRNVEDVRHVVTLAGIKMAH